MKTKIVIFGISGDLSKRKLLPALQQIVATGEFDDVEIIGVSRQQLDARQIFPAELQERSSIFSMDMAKQSDYERLKTAIGTSDQVLLYLSIPPSATHQIVTLLGEAGLTTPNIKLLLEKPFGVDLVSATDMNEHISRYFTPDQVYRIDHYLAKEMAQNIVAFRAGNALFDYVWDSHAIESIEVIATEQIGIEGRTQFYEQTGALRDVLQGHLLQLLSLVLMDVPGELDWTLIPALRLQALQALRPVDPAHAYRAQYDSYQTEVENPGSLTETFIRLELTSTDPRWRGVPIKLVTGKALRQKTTEIRVNFRKSYEAQSNRLIFRIQPDEGVEIEVYTKQPGYERTLQPHRLAFTYSADTMLPDAYEQVIVDAIRSHKSLFTSDQEVLASWRVLQPVLDAWNMSQLPLPTYLKGSDASQVQ